MNFYKIGQNTLIFKDLVQLFSNLGFIINILVKRRIAIINGILQYLMT